MKDMKEYMQELTTLEAFEEAKQSKGVNVFTFSANWCPDCQFIKPFMPQLVEKYKDYHFYYIDRDKLIEAAQELMVMGIPSFVVFKDGVENARFVSKLRKTEQEIDAFLAAQN